MRQIGASRPVRRTTITTVDVANLFIGNAGLNGLAGFSFPFKTNRGVMIAGGHRAANCSAPFGDAGPRFCVS
jgi:hypothetical protein